MHRYEALDRLTRAGFTYDDAVTLRRASMRLRRWYERECGTDNGCIERDETTGRAYWLNSTTMRRCRIPDNETGARHRVEAVVARYPEWLAYHQTDPRGCALYMVNKADLGDRAIDSCYTRGIAVY